MRDILLACAMVWFLLPSRTRFGIFGTLSLAEQDIWRLPVIMLLTPEHGTLWNRISPHLRALLQLGESEFWK